MVRLWIGVGVLYFIFSQVESSQFDKPSLLKELMPYYIYYQSKVYLVNQQRTHSPINLPKNVNFMILP